MEDKLEELIFFVGGIPTIIVLINAGIAIMGKITALKRYQKNYRR